MGFIGDIKDVASIVQKADNIELYAKILDIQAQAMDMQEEIRELRKENIELKKVKDLDEQIERHKEGYITLKNDKDKIMYCSTCWGLYQKLIQICSGRCPACTIAFRSGKK